MPLSHPTDPSLVMDDGLTPFTPGAAMIAGLFGSSTKSASISLTETNRRATLASGGAYHMARGAVPIVGDAYFEYTIMGIPATTGGNIGVGLINDALTNYDAAMTTTNTAGFFAPNNAGGGGGYSHATGFGINGGGYTSLLPGAEWVLGGIIGMAVSMSARTVKITLDGTTWSAPFDITALGGTIYPAIGLYTSGDSMRLNAGKYPFAYTPPTGYSGMDSPTTIYSRWGQVAGADKTYDMGAGITSATGWLAQFEPSAIDKTAGAYNAYWYVIAGSNDPTFATFEEVSNRWQMSSVGTKSLVAFSTRSKNTNTLYRYFRVREIASGASPSITAYAFLAPLSTLTSYTLAELITIQAMLAQNTFDAQAQFRAWMTGTAWGGENHDGVYPLSDGYGNVTYMKCPAQLQAETLLNGPQYYGAIGDGGYHPASDFYATLADLQVKYPWATSLNQEMDFLGWQAVFYNGGFVQTPKLNYRMNNANADSQTPLTLVSGSFDGEGHGCIMLADDMFEQTDSTQFAANKNFATNTDWVNASIYDPSLILMTTFGGGAATMTDTGNPSTPQATFYQWGQQVTLDPGKYTVTMTVSATLGASYALGNNNPPYVDISFSSDSPGEGSNPTGRNAFRRPNVFLPGGAPDVQTMTFDFSLSATTTMWLTFTGGGYANYECTLFSITRWLPNCLMLATRDGSPEHYPIPLGIRGFELVGPGYDVGVSAIRYKSFSNMDGNIVTVSDTSLHDWGRLLSFGDGAYLFSGRNITGYNAGTCIYPESGTFNAGENMRFYDGGFYNSQVCIDGTNGMEITFYGTAYDYCDQMLKNCTGRYEFHGVHCETQTPTDATKPTFHINNGQVSFFGGMFLGAGGINSSPCAPIRTDFSSAVFECWGTELYNLSSDPALAGKGAIMDGPGQFITHGFRNNGNPNLGPLIVSYSPVHDVLGGAGLFPTPDAYTTDPSGILIEGGAFPDALPAVDFTGSITGSILTITAITGLVYEGQAVKGPGVKQDNIISFIPDTGGTGGLGTYRVSRPQNVPSQAMTAQYDGTIDRWNNVNGTLEWSNDYTDGDSNCVKFTKINDGLNSGIRYLIPITPRCSSLGIVKFLSPVDYSPVDPTATVPLYYRLFFVRVIGNDRYNRPIITEAHFAGEDDMALPLAGSLDWFTRSLSTTYQEPSADIADAKSAHSPEDCNYLALFVDTQSLPDGHVFYMSNLRPTLLR